MACVNIISEKGRENSEGGVVKWWCGRFHSTLVRTVHLRSGFRRRRRLLLRRAIGPSPRRRPRVTSYGSFYYAYSATRPFGETPTAATTDEKKGIPRPPPFGFPTDPQQSVGVPSPQRPPSLTTQHRLASSPAAAPPPPSPSTRLTPLPVASARRNPAPSGQWRPDAPAMTFDEVSMERSKNFVKALQELKNLRPQLYSAAEYCEKSYLHNEQKQMVLDNLKDYAVRALVNAVDHLGTVAYKLTDLFEQQTADLSSVELKVSYLDQQLLTYQSYMDKDSLRQQQLFPICPRHHKHYILPNSAIKGLHSLGQTKTQLQSPGAPESKTLLWHLAAESNSGRNEAFSTPSRTEDPKTTPDLFRLADPEGSPLAKHVHTSFRAPASDMARRTLIGKDTVEMQKHLSGVSPLDTPGRREIFRQPARSKSVLTAFFVKNKYPKQKRALVQ